MTAPVTGWAVETLKLKVFVSELRAHLRDELGKMADCSSISKVTSPFQGEIGKLEVVRRVQTNVT